MGVSQKYVYLSGGPHNKDHNMLGSILGSPCFGKQPYRPSRLFPFLPQRSQSQSSGPTASSRTSVPSVPIVARVPSIAKAPPSHTHHGHAPVDDEMLAMASLHCPRNALRAFPVVLPAYVCSSGDLLWTPLQVFRQVCNHFEL